MRRLRLPRSIGRLYLTPPGTFSRLGRLGLDIPLPCGEGRRGAGGTARGKHCFAARRRTAVPAGHGPWGGGPVLPQHQPREVLEPHGAVTLMGADHLVEVWGQRHAEALQLRAEGDCWNVAIHKVADRLPQRCRVRQVTWARLKAHFLTIRLGCAASACHWHIAWSSLWMHPVRIPRSSTIVRVDLQRIHQFAERHRSGRAVRDEQSVKLRSQRGAATSQAVLELLVGDPPALPEREDLADVHRPRQQKPIGLPFGSANIRSLGGIDGSLHRALLCARLVWRHHVA
mmetsp:Transcript_66804/g.159429  ORF Transcript_66804/g.159429 Transcript_66804/m.159429 type:complete len:286 (-) Transcript_66804:254-1111(-)